MDPIPESWPPRPPKELPLFALPNVWLFPYVILPLHVFEPRYKQMVEDILDGAGRIVIGTVVEGHEEDVAGTPPVYPIAGLGEIGRHDRVGEDRFNILLLGLQRVRIREVPSDRLYRKVEVEVAEETPCDPAVEPDLRAKLHEAILERTSYQTSYHPEASISQLTDLLALRMPLTHDVLNGLYMELDEERRARRALAEHEVRPHLPEEKDEEGEGDE